MKRFMLLVLISLLGVANTTFAQEPLTQTYTDSDDLLSFNYPAEWLLDTSQADGILITSVDGIAFGTPTYAPGQVALGITYPGIVTAGLDLPPTAAPLEIFERVQTISTVEGDTTYGEIVELTLAGQPAARMDATNKPTGFIAIGFEAGTVVVLYQTAPDEFETFHPTLLAILDSLRYGEVTTPAEVNSAADPNALTNVVMYENELALLMPATWTLEDDGSVLLIGTSETALTAIANGQAVAAGEVGMGIMASDYVAESFEVPANAAPEVVVEAAAVLLGGTGTIEVYDKLNYPAAITFTSEADAPGGQTITAGMPLIGVALPEGTILLYATLGDDFATIEPLLIEIINTIYHNAD